MVEIKEKLVFCISLGEFLALENISNFRTLHFRMQTQQQKHPRLKKCEGKLYSFLQINILFLFICISIFVFVCFQKDVKANIFSY